MLIDQQITDVQKELHSYSEWCSIQENQICNSVESIVIQGGVGRDEEKSFTLSNLPSLITLEMGCGAFCICHSIVFESMNDWMNDKWDLTQLQSIILGSFVLSAEDNDVEKESSSLRMKSMNELILNDEISLLWMYWKEMITISGL